MEVAEVEEKQAGFDLIVHKRHPKTGKVLATNPYRLFVVQGTQYFERPVGSGNLFFKSGEEAGRMVDGRVRENEQHIKYEVAPTKEELRENKLRMKDKEIEALRKEIAALNREKEQAPKASAKDSIEKIPVEAKVAKTKKG